MNSSEKEQKIEMLKNVWPKNKAKGLLAQISLFEKFENKEFGENAKDKLMPGCWLLSPKEENFFKFRFAFFVHPTVLLDLKGNSELKIKDLLGEKYRPFYSISLFLNKAGIEVIYVIPNLNNKQDTLKSKNGKFEDMEWIFFRFTNEDFYHINPEKLFKNWIGNSGRPSRGGNWGQELENRMINLNDSILNMLFLNELFFSGYLKKVLKKPFYDPYDVDAFIISISQKNIFPIEIKEKFPGKNRDETFFGIDAGRIMMLLRLALPNDANAIYIVKETDQNGQFRNWKYTTLSNIVMASSWNLQAGGIGMGGQNTQTVRIPYDQFKTFDKNTLTEENLEKIGQLSKEIKEMAKEFLDELISKFYGGNHERD
jgi:hypothetical protein